MLGVHRAVAPLLVNPAIDAAFLHHENVSTTAKRRYHNLGRISILMITASAIYTIAEALVIPSFSGGRILSGIMVLIAAFGIGLQLYLLFSRQKQTWLLSRFACERLRSLKFQAYSLVETVNSLDELEVATREFGSREVTRLNSELNAGLSMLDRFVPRTALVLADSAKPTDNPALRAAAFAAFKELRIDYQGRFAASEVHKLEGGQRYAASLSDMMYLLGAGFVLTALTLKLAAPDAVMAGAWVDFLASITFVASIANIILDHGGLSQHATSRFVKYRDGIKQLPVTLAARQKLKPVVADMELLALEELHEFCEASKIISYRM